jgi:hypothetical protein
VSPAAVEVLGPALCPSAAGAALPRECGRSLASPEDGWALVDDDRAERLVRCEAMRFGVGVGIAVLPV